MEPPDVIVFNTTPDKERRIKNLLNLMAWAYKQRNHYIHGRCMIEILCLGGGK